MLCYSNLAVQKVLNRTEFTTLLECLPACVSSSNVGQYPSRHIPMQMTKTYDHDEQHEL